jgi:acetyl-CoA carboxylase biotin carboxyl carrier protein
MFSFDELCQLIRVVSESRVAAVEVEREGARVRIDGVPAAPALAAAPLLPPQLAAMSGAGSTDSAAPPGSGAGDGAEEEGLRFVTSPIVGTFYRSPNPEAPPYVQVGEVVNKGQVLCIVEAMKLMNEIESDMAGTLVRIYPENGQPVEFGERLFAIRPA